MQGPQEDEGEEDEEEEKAGIGPQELVDRGVEDGDGRDEGGNEDLSGKNAVDFSDEGPSQKILSVAKPRVQSPFLDITFRRPPYSTVAAAAQPLEPMKSLLVAGIHQCLVIVNARKNSTSSWV